MKPNSDTAQETRHETLSNNKEVDKASSKQDPACSSIDATVIKHVADKSEVPSSNTVSLKKDKVASIEITRENKNKTDLINTRTLPRDASTYKLETFEKNILIIFNQISIDAFDKPRDGTDKDVEALKNTFEKFGFVVEEHNDKAKKEIFDILEEFTHCNCNNDLSKYGCVAVAVLTHGSNYGFLRAKDMEYNETEIFDHFKFMKNQTLVTKPIVIIIQACRGDELSIAVDVQCSGNTVRDSDEHLGPYIFPADMLILHSCYDGKGSHRLSKGSWFIQELCKQIDTHATEKDLASIMTEVNKQVAIEKNEIQLNLNTGKLETRKQMPVKTSTLTKKLFLRKFSPIKESCIDGDSRVELADQARANSPHIIILKPDTSFVNLYYDFMQTCLKSYIEERPDDETAIALSEEANTSGDIVRISKSILDYLMVNAQNCQCFKQIRVLKN